MELNKEYTRARHLSVEGIQSSADYTLPDSQGDVRKILYSSASVEDGGKFQNADSLEFVGSVSYKIVYLDADGKITPVSFNSDYEFSTKCHAESYVDADAVSRVANFSLRLMGPRRFSVKCAIEADVSVAERAEYRVEGAEGELECREAKVEVATAAFGKGGEIEYAEELAHLGDSIVDEVEILFYSAEPAAVSAVRTEDGVSVKGQILARALIAVRDEMPRIYESVIELSDTIAMPDISAAAVLVPRINILSEGVSANPSEDGVSVVMSLICEATVRALVNSEVSVLKDCFSTQRALKVTEGEFVYTEHIGTKPVCERFSASIARADAGAESIRNVLFESARVKLERVEPSAESVALSGAVQVSGVACEIAEDGTPGYSPLRFETDFAINVNINSQIPENCRCCTRILLEAPHVDVDDGELRISGNLVGEVTVLAEHKERVVGAVSLLDERFERSGSTVSVYYPTAGESLFDVAKSFHISSMEIARANELSEAVCTKPYSSLSASGVDYLLIK